MTLTNSSMSNRSLKKKYVFVGDLNSINIELISKSHPSLKNKVNYILIGNKIKVHAYLKKIKSNLLLNEIFDPLGFSDYKKIFLNIFHIEDISKDSYKNLLNQIKIANDMSNHTKYDLITMPINKSILKKNIEFIGMTEYLGKLNDKKTIMLMHGEHFSIVPYTTHIELKRVNLYLKKNLITEFLNNLYEFIQIKKYSLYFKRINFICHNPHCGEDETLGLEDRNINEILTKYKKISGPIPADSAFLNIKKGTLFISTYHDQALIPFKIINKEGINFTLGLEYRRLSPTHGTASDIKFKNKANNSSYIACMQI